MLHIFLTCIRLLDHRSRHEPVHSRVHHKEQRVSKCQTSRRSRLMEESVCARGVRSVDPRPARLYDDVTTNYIDRLPPTPPISLRPTSPHPSCRAGSRGVATTRRFSQRCVGLLLGALAVLYSRPAASERASYSLLKVVVRPYNALTAPSHHDCVSSHSRSSALACPSPLRTVPFSSAPWHRPHHFVQPKPGADGSLTR